MNKLTLAAFAASLMIAVPAASQNTRLLTADRHNEYGLVYSLPVTALRIDVTAERTVNLAGPYFQYAKKFVGTDKVIRENSENWTITKVSVVPYGIPDEDNKYLMQLKPGAVTYICVDDNGMLLSINREETVTRPAAPEIPENPDPVNIREYLQYVDEDFIASQSSVKQAQMLAENLMEIRDAKTSLTRGTAETMPTDGRQLELMLESLRHQEAAMTAAFTGASYKETVVRSYNFTPEDEGRSVLFRMSDCAGFVDADDYSGDPVYVDVSVTSEGELPVDDKGEEKKLPKDAVIYNVPGAARVELSLLGKKLCSTETEFSQFGVRFGMQPALFSSKKERSFAVFNPVTGGLRELGLAPDE